MFRIRSWSRYGGTSGKADREASCTGIPLIATNAMSEAPALNHFTILWPERMPALERVAT